MLARAEGEAPAGTDGARILSYIERAERLHEERAAIAADIADIFKEAKANGYCVKTLKALLKERQQDPDKQAEAETLLDLYRRAIACTRT